MRKLWVMLAGLLLGSGVAVAAQSLAMADVAWGCPYGTACFYTLTNGGGSERTIAFSSLMITQ
jgi:hypothetical protein